MKRQRPNDPDRIAQRDNLVILSENIATGLANLADNLDQAIRKGSNGKLEHRVEGVKKALAAINA